MRWYFIAAQANDVEVAIDLIYCQQDLSVFVRDIIGNPPYEKATDLVYCQQDLTVFNRIP
jgi:hypothetical protein